jgi:hypothetical protein
LHDHAFAGAIATGTAAGNRTAAIAAATFVATAITARASLSGLAGAALGRGSFAVAAVTTTMATLAALTIMATGSTTVATGTTVATVAGDGRRISAHEGDRDHREKHRNCNSEKTLHFKPPGMELNARGATAAVISQPRSGTATGPQRLNDLRIAPAISQRKPPSNRQRCPARAAGWRKYADCRN